jgi:uncharacterized protein YjiS (DUF1127 family)
MEVIMSTTMLNGMGAAETRRSGVLVKLVHSIRRWHELSRQRSQLARLDERTLRDLGISHAEARQEARRRFWDDPIR